MITRQQLIDMNACHDGLSRFDEQVGVTIQVAPASLVGGANTLSDLAWLICKTKPEQTILLMKSVINLFIPTIEPLLEDKQVIIDYLNGSGDVNAYSSELVNIRRNGLITKEEENEAVRIAMLGCRLTVDSVCVCVERAEDSFYSEVEQIITNLLRT